MTDLLTPQKQAKNAVFDVRWSRGNPDASIITLKSDYDADLVKDCRTIPGRRWDSVKKLNTWPVKSSYLVKELATRWGIDIPADLAALDGEAPPVVYGVQLDEDMLRVEIRFDWHEGMVNSIHQILPEAMFKKSKRYWWARDLKLPQAVHFGQKWNLTIQPGLVERVEADRARAKKTYESSFALDAELDVKVEMELLPFQRAGVAHLLANRRTILGDEMGLGKTVQAIVAADTILRDEAKDGPIIVIATNTGKPNWPLEIEKFCPWLSTVEIFGRTSEEIPEADVVVVNFDIVFERADDLIALEPQALIVDEAHAIKNCTAKYLCGTCGAKAKVNTRNCKECKTKDVQVVEKWTVKRGAGVMKVSKAMPPGSPIYVLTGTPMTNKVAEWVPLLTAIDRINEFGGRWEFLNRYAGAGHNIELNRKLRETGCMIRRRKLDVYKELPPLRNVPQHLSVPASEMNQYRKIEADVVEFLANRARELAAEAGEDENRAYWEKRIRAEAAEHLVRINVLKGAVVDLKYKSVLSWIENFLDGGDEKLIVFAERIEIVENLMAHFGDMAVKVRGGVSTDDRMAAVKRFQEDPTCRLFIGNMAAAGEVITLTAASNVAFIEQAWSPSTHDQCAARCYGRVSDMHGATAWYLLVQNTIDDDINKLLEKKRKLIDAVTDGVEVEAQGSILADLVVDLAERGMRNAK